MGDSQEREFVAIFKNINGSTEAATKFEDVRVMNKAVPGVGHCDKAYLVDCALGLPPWGAGGLRHARVAQQPAHHMAVL